MRGRSLSLRPVFILIAPIAMIAAAAPLAACKSEAKKPAVESTASAGDGAGAGKAASAAAPDAAPVRAAPKPREGGPTQEQCDKFADHLSGFLVESMAPPNANAEQLKYVEGIVKADRANTLRFCLEALEIPEVECAVKATDFPALAACERLRRQVPKEMLGRDEVSAEDCERFFVRHKQFMMAEGVPAAKIDADKDQLVRTCLEKAKPGTIACYLTAATYEEARRCP